MTNQLRPRKLFEYSIGAVTSKPLATKAGVPKAIDINTYATNTVNVEFTNSFSEAIENTLLGLLKYYRKIETNGQFKALRLGRLDTPRENTMIELVSFHEKPKRPFLAAHRRVKSAYADFGKPYTVHGVEERFLFPSIVEYTAEDNWNTVVDMILNGNANRQRGSDWVMFHLPKFYDVQLLTTEMLIREFKRITEDSDAGSDFHLAEKFHPQSSVKVVEADGVYYLWDTKQGEFDLEKLSSTQVRHQITEFNFDDSFTTFQTDYVEPTKVASFRTTFNPDSPIDVYILNASERTYGDGETRTVRRKTTRVLLQRDGRKLVVSGNLPVYKSLSIQTDNLTPDSEKEIFEKSFRKAYSFVEHR